MQKVFHCGCCDEFHRSEFTGDCRDDSERLSIEDIITRFGIEGKDWEEITPLESAVSNSWVAYNSAN